MSVGAADGVVGGADSVRPSSSSPLNTPRTHSFPTPLASNTFSTAFKSMVREENDVSPAPASIVEGDWTVTSGIAGLTRGCVKGRKGERGGFRWVLGRKLF